MTAVNTRRQKVARSTLDKIFAEASSFWVIHYSCESFYNTPEGRSPRITSIAVRKLDSGQTFSFSIHKVAEIKRVPLSDIDEQYDCLEREMLQDFYRHLKNYQQMKYLHWNMRDSNYGFQAIEHRFRVLGGKDDELYVVDENNKTNLARLLIEIYGTRYVEDPRLHELLKKNNISQLDFLTGKDEATAFVEKDLVALHRSTLRKVDVISGIATRAHDRTLKTNTSWLDMNGGRVAASYNWIIEHPKLELVGIGVAVIIAIIGFAYR